MPSEHCREFDDRSRELTSLDLLLTDARLTDHARACAACSARRTEMLRLQSAVTAMRSAPPAVDLTVNVLQQWRSEQRTASPSASASFPQTPVEPAAAPAAVPPAGPAGASRNPPAAGRTARLITRTAEPESSRPAAPLALVTSVAVLLLAAITLNSVQHSPPVSPGHQLAVTRPAPEEQPEVSPPLASDSVARMPTSQPVPLDRLVWNAGNAWVGLTAATMTQVTTSALATTGTGPGMESVDTENPDAHWLRELEGTLGPVRDDLSRTVEFLMETLPLSDASTI